MLTVFVLSYEPRLLFATRFVHRWRPAKGQKPAPGQTYFSRIKRSCELFASASVLFECGHDFVDFRVDISVAGRGAEIGVPSWNFIEVEHQLDNASAVLSPTGQWFSDRGYSFNRI